MTTDIAYIVLDLVRYAKEQKDQCDSLAPELFEKKEDYLNSFSMHMGNALNAYREIEYIGLGYYGTRKFSTSDFIKECDDLINKNSPSDESRTVTGRNAR